MNDQTTKSEEPASKREGGSGSSCNALLSGDDPPDNEYLLKYWELHEPLVGALLGSIEKIRGHFDDDGNIRGSGQWRLREIFSAVTEAEQAEKTCLDGLHEFHESTVSS